MGKSVYLTAAAITVVIFFSVFLFVKLDEQARFDSLSEEILYLYEEQQANRIFEAYLEDGDETACVVYREQISRQLSRVYELFSKLERLEEVTFATSSSPVKKQYLLTSMALWVDLRNAKEKCDIGLKPVLFFFPDTWLAEQPGSCVECDALVEQLEIVKEHCPNVRVFAFPFESDEFAPVELLKSDYGVSRAPALVVEGQVLYSMGPTEQLLQLLGC